MSIVEGLAYAHAWTYFTRSYNSLHDPQRGNKDVIPNPLNVSAFDAPATSNSQISERSDSTLELSTMALHLTVDPTVSMTLVGS